MLLTATALWGAIALFPPCRTPGGSSAPRTFLLFVGGSVEVNAGRLLAEALLIVALAGFALIYVWGEDA